MSQSSSTSSLLQQHRPESLPPLPSLTDAQQEELKTQWLEKHERARLSKGLNNSSADLRLNQSSAFLNSPMSCSTPNLQFSSSLQPVASTSTGIRYLNMEPTSSPSGEHATACTTSPVSPGNQCVRKCNTLLATAPASAVGEAMSKSRWQPDESSALCTFPLCTANFAQTNYFFIGPRRHHCRLCGQLFCSSHTSQRAPLMHTDGLGKRYVAQERVCDLCLPLSHAEEANPGLSAFGRRDSSCTESEPCSDNTDLITPHSEDGPAHASSSSIFRAGSRVTLELAQAEASELAPIEEWMDRSGVLSLYPLAVNASHSRIRRSHSPSPAAGPLFAPSIKAKRDAKEKEIERLTLRERRLGLQNNNFWLPAKWGYKQEDFDPSFSQVDEDDAAEREVGGVVEDGPIRFRTGVRKVTTPLGAPISARV